MRPIFLYLVGLALPLGLGACGGGGGQGDCDPGSEACECLSGMQCHLGLECHSDVCVDPNGTGGTDGSGDDGGDDDGGDDTGDPLDDCPGSNLSTEGALDLDIAAIQVSGNITLNDSAMPDATSTRGQVVFTDEHGITIASVSLGSTGAASYALTLPPATYDITFVGNPELCSGTNPPAVPCGSGTLRSGVSINADGALDIDIPAVQITGTVSLDGAAFPAESSSRGALGFKTVDGDAVTVSGSLGSSGSASYAVTLLPDTYDIQFLGNPSLCDGGSPVIPCNSGTISNSVDLTQSGALDVEVSGVRVSGSVTLNGNTMPAQDVGRGALTFSRGDDAGITTESFGSSGDATYAVTLIPGNYDITLAANPDLCDGNSPPDVPCVSGELMSGVNINSDGALGVDVPAVKVSGAVTVNGAAMPTESESRGNLSFTRDEFVGFSGNFGTTGAASYAITVLPGTYDIGLASNPTLCATGTPQVPCISGPVRKGVALNSDGALDIDIPSLQVSGSVTVDGSTMADESESRGSILFNLLDGGEVAGSVPTQSFGSTGAASYSATLIPGQYVIAFGGNPALCSGGSAPSVPCITGPIQTSTLEMGGALDLDVAAVQLSGGVTVNGNTMPDESEGRGALVFSLRDDDGVGGDVTTQSFGSSGAADYFVTILPGDYVVTHAANPGLCDGAQPSVPCASQALLGCD